MAKFKFLKKIGFLEYEIDKKSAILSGIELQLADESIYKLDEKDRLKRVLADQALAKATLIDLESEWMETQEMIEKKIN